MGSDQMPGHTDCLAGRRVTVDEYHHMIDAGFFVDDDRFELLEGEIVARPTRDPPNATTMQLVRRALDNRLPPGWHTRTQCGFTTGDSEPEPAAAVVRGEPLDYWARHPGPSDAALVVEVSNARLALDRDVKGRLYARARVGEYWIVNLIDDCIECHSDPAGAGASAGFRSKAVFRPGERLALRVDERDLDPIPVNEILPWADS